MREEKPIHPAWVQNTAQRSMLLSVTSRLRIQEACVGTMDRPRDEVIEIPKDNRSIYRQTYLHKKQNVTCTQKSTFVIYYCMLFTRIFFLLLRKLSYELILCKFFHVILQDIHISCTYLVLHLLLLFCSVPVYQVPVVVRRCTGRETEDNSSPSWGHPQQAFLGPGLASDRRSLDLLTRGEPVFSPHSGPGGGPRWSYRGWTSLALSHCCSHISQTQALDPGSLEECSV